MSTRSTRVGRLHLTGLMAASVAALMMGALVAPAHAMMSTATYWERGTVMSPRFQWNANSGYCGETAFISAGMRFGQYTSQWTARSLASPGVDQWKPSSQLLLGVNDLRAAKAIDSWTIPAGSGPTWSVTINALTSDTRVFRAVPVSAP